MGRFRVLAVAAILAATMGMGAAKADPLPGLTNFEFTQYSGTAPKGAFSDVKPTGWTSNGGLIFVDSQDFANSAAGPIYLQTHGNPTGTIAGNYIEAAGNPANSGSFSYLVTGLTPGTTYTLGFYQGASEQAGYSSKIATVSQWIVSLGNTPLSVASGGPVDPVYGATSRYFSADPNASIAATSLMTVGPGQTVGWNYVTVDLTASATQEMLSFLAWSDKGSAIDLGPVVFLAGVNTPAVDSNVPEPASWTMMALGFLAVGGLLRGARRFGRDGAVATALPLRASLA